MFLNSINLKPKKVHPVLTQHFKHLTSKPTEKPDAKKITSDFIGPVDPVSNLRQHVWHIPKTETKLQRKLRERRDAVDASNQAFWRKHNEAFYKDKKAFIEAQNIATGDGGEVPADKMSEFYKKFLDANYKRHAIYNRVWYKQNFQILLLALQVELESIFKRITSKKQ